MSGQANGTAGDAIACYNRGERDKAARMAGNLLAADPRDINALYLLGTHHLDAGRPGAALAAFERVLALAPGQPAVEAATERAFAALFQDVQRLCDEDRFPEARAVLELPAGVRAHQRVSTAIRHVGALAFTRAVGHYNGSRHRAALDLFILAASCDGGNVTAIHYAAKLLAAGGAHREALRWLLRLPADAAGIGEAVWECASCAARALGLYADGAVIDVRRDDSDPADSVAVCRSVLSTHGRQPDARLVCALADSLGSGADDPAAWDFVREGRGRSDETVTLYRNLARHFKETGRPRVGRHFAELAERTAATARAYRIGSFDRWPEGRSLQAAAGDPTFEARRLYVELLAKSLHMADPWLIDMALARPGLDLKSRNRNFDRDLFSLTLLGDERLRQLSEACRTVLHEGIPGDFIETGVWRGGACILMRGVLEAYGDRERRVFVADSFEGLPEPEANAYPIDAGSVFHKFNSVFAVSDADVRRNFARYGLLDEQIVFLKGWFKDTLATDAITRLAVLRLDGDMYQSTMEALTALYDKVSDGGYVIVDDYNIGECKEAIIDFRADRGIDDRIFNIDGMAVFWRKGRPAG